MPASALCRHSRLRALPPSLCRCRFGRIQARHARSPGIQSCRPTLGPPAAQALLLASGERLSYDRLCICAGAAPKQLPAAAFVAAQQGGQPCTRELEQLRRRVLTIRDTDSVARLARQLASARSVAVVGNGGIALELV